jgi:hypothetical protein
VAYARRMTDDDRAQLEAIHDRRQEAHDAGNPLEPLVSGPEHALLAKQIGADLRSLEQSASDLAELVGSWQYLAGMCGLFDDLPEPDRPDSDWRDRIEQALAFIEEATA